MTIEELHDHLFDVLVVIDNICREHNIRYCLDGGTELGAVREKDFIPWDDDMDICVLSEDYEAFIKIMKLYLPEHYHICEPRDSSPFFFDNVTRIFDDRWRFGEELCDGLGYDNYQSPVGTDVFIYCGCPRHKLAQRIFNLKNKIFHGMLMAYRHKIEWNKYTCFQRLQIAVLRQVGKMFSGKSPDRILEKRKEWIFRYNAKETGYRISVNAPLYDHYMHAMKNQWFYPLTSAEIRGRQFPIESGYAEKLTTIYGDYMTPKKDFSKYIQHLN